MKSLRRLARTLRLPRRKASLVTPAELQEFAKAQVARFQTIFEMAPSAFAVVLGENHVFQLANKKYEELVNRTGLIGKPVAEVIPEVIEQGYIAALDRVYQTGERFEARETLVHLTGDLAERPPDRYLDFNFEPIRDDRGNVIGSVIVAVDVTEHVRTRKELEEKNQLEIKARQTIDEQRKWLESVLGALPIPVLILDSKSTRPIFVNAAADKMLNLPLLNTSVDDRGSLEVVVRDSSGRLLEPQQFPSARACRGENSSSEEFYLRTPGGEYYITFSAAQLPQNFTHEASTLLVLNNITAQKKAEIAMMESEQRFRAYFDFAFYGIAVSDLNGRILKVNPAFQNMFGYTEGELQGMHIAHVTHPNDRERTSTELKRLMAGEVSSVRIEKRYLRKNGTIFLAEIVVSLTRNHLGEPINILGVIEDVSEKRLAEEALNKSETRYRLASHATRDMIWDWNLVTDEVEWNESLISELGYETDARKSTASWWYEHLHPEDRDRVVHGIHRVIDGGGSMWSDEYQFRKADGTYVYVLDRGHIAHDKTGQAIRMIGAMQDLTRERDAIAKLKESEEQFRLLAEQLPQMVFITEPNGSVTYFNARWYEYIGSGSKDTEGWGWSHKPIHHPDDLGRTVETWRRSLETGANYEIEYRLRRHDGVYRWHLGRAVPIRDEEGRILRWMGTNTDIDDQKRAVEIIRGANDEYRQAKEQAESASLAKSQFLANMSHEIRTPLGAIMGFLDLLRNASSPQETESYISTIDRNSVQLMRIVDDILDLSKIEAGKMLIEKIDFSLTELLSDFSALMSFKAREKGVEFNVKLKTALPIQVTTDPTRLRQILNNVVGNAIKFTDKGSVDLVVSYENEMLSLEVVDTGRGISFDQAAKLFQPFVQADPSTTRRFGGTGLGLALTRHLAQALDGDFVLKWSELGKGSTFVVTMRVGAPQGTTLVERPSLITRSVERRPMDSNQDFLGGMRILLVEDSPDNQVLLRILISKMGGAITIASNGREGVERALAEDFDVVLMDIQMPLMDGHEATRELRRRGYRQPIIALTAHAMKEERERTSVSGFTDFLTKPINREELRAKLKFYSNVAVQ